MARKTLALVILELLAESPAKETEASSRTLEKSAVLELTLYLAHSVAPPAAPMQVLEEALTKAPAWEILALVMKVSLGAPAKELSANFPTAEQPALMQGVLSLAHSLGPLVAPRASRYQEALALALAYQMLAPVMGEVLTEFLAKEVVTSFRTEG